MSAVEATELMTSEQLFAMRPSKKVDRWLFRGELRESKVTKRNPSHSGAVIKLGHILTVWLLTLPLPRGKIYGGEAYFRIRKDPDTNVGIDVALASAEQVAATAKRASFVDGPPILAAEVLSPFDKVKEIAEAVDEYLACGVQVVWVVDPYTETVFVHRPNKKMEVFTTDQMLTGDPELPGLTFRVGEIFE